MAYFSPYEIDGRIDFHGTGGRGGTNPLALIFYSTDLAGSL
jgi:hypothetical protein